MTANTAEARTVCTSPRADTDVHPVLDPRRIAAALPQPWRTRYEEGNEGPGALGYWNPNGIRRADAVLPDGSEISNSAEGIVANFLDVYDLDWCVLNADRAFFTLSPELDFAAAVCSAANDVLAEEFLEQNPRLKGAVTVAPFDPAAAAREIRRVGGHPGFVQVLVPSGAPMSYGHRYYEPMFEAAAELALPVAIHPALEGVGLSGMPTRSGYPANYLEWHTGLVSSFITHLLSLVTEGTFQKFPDLRVILTEGGVSWLPVLMWRFDKNWKALRQLAPWLDRAPSEIIADHVLLTSQPIEEPARREHLHQVLAMFPSERMLMYSSDFPHWDGDMPDFSGRRFPQHSRDRIMGETASELYGVVNRSPGAAA